MNWWKSALCFLAGLIYVEASWIQFTASEGGLDVEIRGQTAFGAMWSASPATDADEPFLNQHIFQNGEVMKFLDNGEPCGSNHASECIKASKDCFGVGSPRGSLVIRNESNTPIGWAIAGGGDEPGASEFAIALIPDLWGYGYGKSIVESFVKVWGPEVRQIGLGLPSDSFQLAVGEDADSLSEEALGAKIKSSFCCFGSKALERLDATTSPDNLVMQRILGQCGFHPAQSKVMQPEVLIILSGKDVDKPGESLNRQLMEWYTQENPLEKGQRYSAQWNGTDITFSWSKAYDCIKLHYEYHLPNPEDGARAE